MEREHANIAQFQLIFIEAPLNAPWHFLLDEIEDLPPFHVKARLFIGIGLNPVRVPAT